MPGIPISYLKFEWRQITWVIAWRDMHFWIIYVKTDWRKSWKRTGILWRRYNGGMEIKSGTKKTGSRVVPLLASGHQFEMCGGPGTLHAPHLAAEILLQVWKNMLHWRKAWTPEGPSIWLSCGDLWGQAKSVYAGYVTQHYSLHVSRRTRTPHEGTCYVNTLECFLLLTPSSADHDQELYFNYSSICWCCSDFFSTGGFFCWPLSCRAGFWHSDSH